MCDRLRPLAPSPRSHNFQPDYSPVGEVSSVASGQPSGMCLEKEMHFIVPHSYFLMD